MIQGMFGACMTIRRQNRSRSFFAAICLLAVALLYAPLAAAAWSSYSASCCTSDQCPIKEHHRQRLPAPPENHMDCGHEMAGLSACTMSCCQNPDRPAITSVAFVLPPAVSIPPLAAFASAFEFPKLLDSLLSIAPLFPPPRL
jgi:hypothetical protein